MPKIRKSDAEWKAQLSPEAYRVAREHGTERAFSHPYNNEKASGTYACVCCGKPLFEASSKFDSGTGWPSYWQPIADGLMGTKTDFKMVVPRTECHCATCGMHMGHVFNDGPPPTGMRWCINGTVLDFRPAE